MIVDTNALSAWFDGDEALLSVMSAPRLLVLPVIVIGEYRYGVQLSTQRTDREAWLDRAISALQVVPITLATADSYAAIRRALHRKGRPIPPNDTWIAALAIQHSLPILSRDTHFDVVDGIQRIGW
ncbi:MAG: type II toxin-antitoxin system VapC family toxin [Chloroflexota bacterium]